MCRSAPRCAVGLLLVLGLGACTSSTIPYTLASGPAPTISVSVPALGSCGLGALPAAWASSRDVLARGGDSAKLVAYDASAAATYLVRMTGTVERLVRIAGGQERTIYQVDTAKEWQIHVGAVEGRWLAFTVISTGGWNDFKLLVWDAESEKPPRVVSESTRTADGVPVPGPVIVPAIDQGVLYWAQVQADSETSVVKALRLSDQTTADFPGRKGGGTPVIFGDLLVWREYGPLGPVSVVKARNISTGAEAATPAALATATSDYIASDGTTLIWTSAEEGHLVVHYARVDGRTGSIRLPGTAVSSLSVSGDVVAVLTDERTWIADLTSGQYVAATEEWGYGHVDHGVLVVSDSPGPAATHVSWLVRLSDVGLLPACG